MLTYFHRHKHLFNEKGQLIPIFIVIIVVILIMVMVTVNIGKVALTKTDSANSADAGALAGGSAMANLFNNIVAANSQMKASFQEFYMDSATLFTIALSSLIPAQTSAITGQSLATDAQKAGGEAHDSGAQCLEEIMSDPCTGAAMEDATAALASAGEAAGTMGGALGSINAALGSIKSFIGSVHAMNVMVISFATSQQFFYMSVRKMADEGWKSAKRISHQLSFKNSGVSSRLKPGLEQAAFANFMKGLKENDRYDYPWLDGQLRPHLVTSIVDIQKVDRFSLKVTAMPLPAEIGLLAASLGMGYAVKGTLEGTRDSYSAAEGSYGTAAGEYGKVIGDIPKFCADKECCLNTAEIECCFKAIEDLKTLKKDIKAALSANKAGLTSNGTGLGTNQASISTITPIYPTFSGALAGLTPGPTVVSSSGGDSAMYIIDCIDEVDHDRKVHTKSEQSHGGRDLGFWNFRYPGLTNAGNPFPTTSESWADFTGYGSIKNDEPRFDPSLYATDISAPLDNGVAFDLGCILAEHEVKRLKERLEIYNGSATSLDGMANDVSGESQDIDNRIGDLGSTYSTQDLLNQNNNAANEVQQLQQSITDFFQGLLEFFQQIMSTFTGNANVINGMGNQYNTLRNETGRESGNLSDAANDIADVSEKNLREAQSIQAQIDAIKAEHPQCNYNSN